MSGIFAFIIILIISLIMAVEDLYYRKISVNNYLCATPIICLMGSIRGLAGQGSSFLGLVLFLLCLCFACFKPGTWVFPLGNGDCAYIMMLWCVFGIQRALTVSVMALIMVQVFAVVTSTLRKNLTLYGKTGVLPFLPFLVTSFIFVMILSWKGLL